ncbi:MAG: serine/threonine-protein kinase [Myxococcales bacterium]
MLPRIDRYDITNEIGHGGMATVYRARDTRLDRWVAVKVMHPHLRGTEQARVRFSREARAVARLKHASILEIYDYSGNESDNAYIATELLTGPTLKGFLEQVGVVPPEIAVAICIDLAHGLSAAHAQGIIHRDVKPENVLLHEARQVKLTDFGIADMLDPSMSAMTATGQILGSPAHMAPEQVEGGDTDARSDIFALGTILYWLATGSLPFTGKNPHQVLKRVVDCAPTDPLVLRSSIGRDLRDIILRCLSKQPSDRYPSAEQLALDLEKYLNELGIPDGHALLESYLRDPGAESKRLHTQVLEALLAQARKAVSARDRPRAIALLDRVLALEDGHAEGLRLLAALDRAAKRRILARAAIGALAASLVATLWVTFVPRSEGTGNRAAAAAGREPTMGPGGATAATKPRETGTAPLASAPATRVPGSSTAPETSPTPTPPKRSSSPRGSRERPQVPVSEATGPRTVRFDPDPANVSISVDGEPARHFGPSFRMLELAAGTHSFRFIGAHDCCEDRVVEVDVPAGPGETVVAAKLPFRPARVYVVSDVPADVQIDDGAAVGRSRSLINVPIERSYIERRRISVTAPGHEAYTGSIQLRAGQVTQLDVVLKPSAAP